MKKLLPLLLTLSILTALSTTALAANTFTDVPADHWAYANIERAYADGVVGGYGNGLYQPAATLTMAQYTVIMTRAFYKSAVESASDQSSWCSAHLEAALRHGLLDNTSYTLDGPDTFFQPCSRYDMAAIMANILHNLQLSAYDIAGDPAKVAEIGQRIADFGTIPQWYQGPVAALFSAGVINGVDSSGTFAGGSTVNRGQAAAIYCRFASLVSPSSTAPSNETPKPAVPSASGSLTAPQLDVQTYTLAELREQMLALVNEARLEAGLNTLTMNDKLHECAQKRAEEYREVKHHLRPDGSHYWTIFAEMGVTDAPGGENAAAVNIYDTHSVFEAWMNSPSHRDNILDPLAKAVGYGLYVPDRSGCFILLFTR